MDACSGGYLRHLFEGLVVVHVFVAGVGLQERLESFFNMTRFGFQKLQFEIVPFRYHYEKDGIVLNPESPVLNTHIPRTGERLDPESVRRSYELGAAFFKESFHFRSHREVRQICTSIPSCL